MVISTHLFLLCNVPLFGVRFTILFIVCLILFLILMPFNVIKTSGSESRGQEEAACMRVLGLCDHYSELFTRMEALNF